MSQPEPPPASLRLRIDTQALAANWRTLDAMSGEAAAGAAVKADAYGLGVDTVVPTIREAGARHFFLAHWSEVPGVLAHTDGPSIAVLHGVLDAQDAAFGRATGALPVINSVRQAALWQKTGGGPCHLMVDTGINRLGIAMDELGDPAITSLQVDTLMSHLACADEDSAMNARQLALFRDAVAVIDAAQYSLANSAGLALGPDYHFDLTRPGIALYGGIVRPELDGRIRQVAYPEAAILQTRQLQPGDSVGYNAKWTAEKPTRAATVSIGYADGFLRALGPGGALQHGGRTLPILGRVSMDMVIVDASDTDLREGDFLEIPFEIREVAARSGLSQYELLTVLGKRFDPS